MPDCKTCKDKQSVPGHAFEVAAAEFHFVIRRLIAVIITLVILLVGSNIAWIVYESQFEEVVETVTEDYSIEASQEAENGNNYAVNGDINGQTTR